MAVLSVTLFINVKPSIFLSPSAMKFNLTSSSNIPVVSLFASYVFITVLQFKTTESNLPFAFISLSEDLSIYWITPAYSSSIHKILSSTIRLLFSSFNAQLNSKEPIPEYFGLYCIILNLFITPNLSNLWLMISILIFPMLLILQIEYLFVI